MSTATDTDREAALLAELEFLRRQLAANSGAHRLALADSRLETEEALESTRQAQAAEQGRSALLELVDCLRDEHDPAAMAIAAARCIGEALGVARVGYGTLGADDETFTVDEDWVAAGNVLYSGQYGMKEYGSYADELRRGETVVVPNVYEDPRIGVTTGTSSVRAVQALINQPVVERGKTVAILYVNSASPRQWTAAEVEFVRDVAERTRVAVQRRRAEADLRDLAASLERQVVERTHDRNSLWRLSSDIMLRCGFDGLISAVNPAWTSVLGWSEEELVGSNLFDLIHPDDLAETLEGAKALSQGVSHTRFDNRYRHRDGSNRWISWSMSPDATSINAVGRDFTVEREKAEALQAAEQALRQSQKMEAVGQLTGGLAHDFNNLLAGISGSLELMQTRIGQGRFAELDRYMTVAQGAAKRAAALTHRLLAFSRRQTLDPKPTNVNRLVADMEELVRRTVGPAIDMEVVGMAGLWPVLIDPGQLENALLNLCINARDAMAEGGRLTIETANKRLDEHGASKHDLPAGQYISLCVTDTGSGMPPEVIAKVFEPFFTTKPMGQGTGLGLSMVYGFARQSGGQVRIYSELDEGTTVCLYLPRHDGETDVETVVRGSDAGRAEQGETVLIVDDEPSVRMLVVEILEDLGYTAIEAADGASGLKVLQSDARVDLLVTDVGLPGGMNGRQMADAARDRRPELKVLFITGYAENAMLGNGHLKPGMQVMTKPFVLEALAARIKDIIATGRAT